MSLTIAQENALTGGVAAKDVWLTGNAVGIPAFVRRSYYQPGETAQFSADCGNIGFTVEIWRFGWYGGGTWNSRKVATVTGTAVDQPAASVIPNSNNALECSSWTVNATWDVPADATPGWYWALFRASDNSKFGQVAFCVTDTLERKPVVVLSGEATWMGAYNFYGGKTAVGSGSSLYGSSGPLSGGIDNRAYCVSYDRPVVTRENIPQTYFFNAEYPLLRFLERIGVEAGHVTCEQVDADPTVLDGRAIIIVAGHNEYISQRIWDKFEQLRASTSTRLVNLAGNDFFWRTRHGTSTVADTSTRGRVMWARKDTMPGPSGHVAGTPIVANDWGGTYQDSRWADRTSWSEQLWGDRFIANGPRSDNLKVGAEHKNLPMWRNCPGIQALTTGQSFDFGAGTLGMEWDMPSGSAQKALLSSTTVTLSAAASDINGQNYDGTATPTHSMIFMRTPGGGAIFNASNVQFSWTLDASHDRGSAVSTLEGRQGFLNMLVDLGAVVSPESVTAASLTYPTPTIDLAAAYGLTGTISPPPSAGLDNAFEIWIDGAWKRAEILGPSGNYELA